MRPNPSLEWTATGKPLGPPAGLGHHPSSGPSAFPASAPSAQTLGRSMSRLVRYITSGFVLLLVALGSFTLGAKSGVTPTPLDVFNAELAAIQTSLGHNHLVRYRELESELSRGCVAEVQEKLRISVDQQMQLLASLNKSHPDNWATKAIAEREPQLPAQLQNFVSKYGTSWREPQCPQQALSR